MYVYFIQCGKRGPIKVGVTKDVSVRLDTLQTASPIRLRMIHKFSAPGEKAAYEAEKYIHKNLKKQRVSGEWFFLIWYIDQIINSSFENYNQIFGFKTIQKFLFETFGEKMGKYQMRKLTHWH